MEPPGILFGEHTVNTTFLMPHLSVGSLSVFPLALPVHSATSDLVCSLTPRSSSPQQNSSLDHLFPFCSRRRCCSVPWWSLDGNRGRPPQLLQL